MKRSSFAAAVAVFVCLGAVGGGLAWYKKTSLESQAGGAGYEPAETVEVAEARSVLWQPTADLVGTVVSLRSVRVSNELAGVVKRVGFESGGIVEAGQVLLELDDSTDRADLAAAQASVRVAEATVAALDARLRLTETEVRRMEGAAQANAAAQIELDRLMAELEESRAERERLLAEVDAARARAEQVQTRLNKMTIRAPFRGRAGLRSIHEGQYLAEGTPVVQLEEIADQIYLDFAIPQEHLARVRPGVSVLATGEVLGPEPVRIEVVAVDATVDHSTRNIRVRCIVDNREERLRAGMFVRIRVPTDEPRPYVTVPATAARRMSYADQVFELVPGEQPGMMRAKQRFVRLGPTIGDDVIVLEGLEAGKVVAASGAFKLRDGSLVSPAQAGGAEGQVGGAPGEAGAQTAK